MPFLPDIEITALTLPWWSAAETGWMGAQTWPEGVGFRARGVEDLQVSKSPWLQTGARHLYNICSDLDTPDNQLCSVKLFYSLLFCGKSDFKYLDIKLSFSKIVSNPLTPTRWKLETRIPEVKLSCWVVKSLPLLIDILMFLNKRSTYFHNFFFVFRTVQWYYTIQDTDFPEQSAWVSLSA